MPDLLVCSSTFSLGREYWEELPFSLQFPFPNQSGPSLAARADNINFELFVQHSERTRGPQNEEKGMIAPLPSLYTGG